MDKKDDLIRALLASSFGTGASFPFSQQPPVRKPLEEVFYPRIPIKPKKTKIKIEESRKRINLNLRAISSGKITEGRVLPSVDEIGLASGRRLQIALFYADLRGFSKLVSSQNDRRVIKIMDSFVTEAARIAADFGGELIDCAGDRVLVAFAKPSKDKDIGEITRKAVAAAFWLQKVVSNEINGALINMNYPPIHCGIGVDAGQVIVTRVGIRNRNKLVILGDPANLAAKIEALAMPSWVHLSPTAFRYRPPYMVQQNGWQFQKVDHPELGTYFASPSTFSCDEIPIV